AGDQDDEEDEYLHKTKEAEGLELDRPGKQKNGLHIEHHEQDRDDVIADGIASASIVDRIDSPFVRQELGLAGIIGANQFRRQQRDWKQHSDDSHEDEDGNVVLRHRILARAMS